MRALQIQGCFTGHVSQNIEIPKFISVASLRHRVIRPVAPISIAIRTFELGEQG